MGAKKSTLTKVKNVQDFDMPMNQLSKSQQSSVNKIVKNIDIYNTQEVIQYGLGAQTEISEFTGSILDTVRAKDTGYVGETLTGLMTRVQDIDVGNFGQGSFMKRIPVIGPLFNKSKKFIAKYEKLSTQVDTILDNLEIAKLDLFKDIELLDRLYDKNINYVKKIEVYIIAGTIKLKELNEKVLPELKKKADETNNPSDIQKFNDVKNIVTNFERKLHDLKLTRMIAIQTAPQIRIIQSNDQSLAEKIQGSMVHTIPLWKSQMVLALSAMRQEKALKVQNEVTQTTNELLKKNSQMMKQNAVGVAKEMERGIVDIDVLKQSQADLISTIEETLSIQAEGKRARLSAEVELNKMEKDLKVKLLNVKRKELSEKI